MWRRSARWVAAGGLCAAALVGAAATCCAQRADLPPGPMQQKARVACLPCHTAQIITQQQLDRRVWAKEIDKMIRWGAPVAPEDRDAIIDYFTNNFGPREPVPAEAKLPPGPGAARVRAACLGCHDAGIIVEQRWDRRMWAQDLDKMIRWGAKVRAADRPVILNYLVAHFSTAVQPARKSAKSP